MTSDWLQRSEPQRPPYTQTETILTRGKEINKN